MVLIMGQSAVRFEANWASIRAENWSKNCGNSTMKCISDMSPSIQIFINQTSTLVHVLSLWGEKYISWHQFHVLNGWAHILSTSTYYNAQVIGLHDSMIQIYASSLCKYSPLLLKCMFTPLCHSSLNTTINYGKIHTHTSTHQKTRVWIMDWILWVPSENALCDEWLFTEHDSLWYLRVTYAEA